MWPNLLLIVCCALKFNAMFTSHHAMADFNGLINIDDPTPTSHSSESSEPVNSTDHERDGYNAVMSDESGSERGEAAAADASVVGKTREETPATTYAKKTTEIDEENAGSAEELTTEPGSIITEEPIEDRSTDEDSSGYVDDTDDPSQKSPNGEAKLDKRVLWLSTEVIVGVAVGAVCVVIFIAVLVCHAVLRHHRDVQSYGVEDFL